LNKATSTEEKARLKADLLAAGNAVGLLNEDPEEWFTGDHRREPPTAQLEITTHAPTVSIQISEDRVRSLIDERATARLAKDFAKADRIRDELADEGIALEDKPDGTTDWRRA
jgi:cysteinyl-tRNA synthetase